MILLADGGSTKVDWCLVSHGKAIKQVCTKGANPFFRSSEDISEELKENLFPEISEYDIKAAYFYGAGCAFPEKNEIIRSAIANSLHIENIEVGSDLLAAAKGLCGHSEGIACILGTGSNSCFFDGYNIIANVSSLGYILGDEGSGAVLGRLLVSACLKNQLTAGLKEKFLEQFNLTQAEILNSVYKQPLANRFLAGLSPFLLQHIEDETIYNLVYNAFNDFFVKNVMQYDYKNYPVHFAGSIAYYYEKILRNVGQGLGIEIGNIVQSPMPGLINYYSESDV